MSANVEKPLDGMPVPLRPAQDIGPVVLQDTFEGAVSLGGFMSRLLCIGLGNELAVFGVAVIPASAVIPLRFRVDPRQALGFCICNLTGAGRGVGCGLRLGRRLFSRWLHDDFLAEMPIGRLALQ